MKIPPRKLTRQTRPCKPRLNTRARNICVLPENAGPYGLALTFAAQYANLATYNNYGEYYRHFQPNNATVGVSIHLPFLNLAQHAKIQEAEADALKAKKQAEAARNQVSEQTLRLERAVTQMQAARDVAELEYEIAQKNVEAVQTRMKSSTANLHDLDNAQTQASEKLIALARCHLRSWSEIKLHCCVPMEISRVGRWVPSNSTQIPCSLHQTLCSTQEPA